jgi:dihydroorotase
MKAYSKPSDQTIQMLNAWVYDGSDTLKQQHVSFSQGKITAIGSHIDPEAHTIDAQGRLLAPGFIDVHVHLREPGLTHKETVQSGSLSAAAGGFTQICAMPNTRPVIDKVEHLQTLQAIIKDTAQVKVHAYSAITEHLDSDTLVDFAAMKAAGAFAYSNDGVGVQSSGVMYRAMQSAKALDMAIVAHCEDCALLNGGALHEGRASARFHDAGISSISESAQIARDILLAEASGCHLHICHVSTQASVRIIRDAKRAGLRISAEVTPHHLLLCEDDIIESQVTNFKMNPPLRAKEDQMALIEGLLDGTIDFIATDHAPHQVDEKAKPLASAPFGIIGLEHAFALLYTHLVKPGVMSLPDLLNRLSTRAAKVFHMEGGVIAVGAVADLVLIDLDKATSVTMPGYSLSQNTPFVGWSLAAQVDQTWVNGCLVFDRSNG